MRWAAILILTAVSAAAQCNYAFSPPEISIGASEFSHTITVYANPGCGWVAQSQNPDWIQVILGGSGVGNGQFVVRVRENLTPELRIGGITIPNATLRIQQQPATCTYSLTPPTMRVSTAKGLGTFFITSRCAWTARSESSFIRLSGQGSTGITSGIGNGAVVFEYDENTSSIARAGAINVAPGVSFRLTQDGTACDVTLPAPFLNIQPQGGTFGFDVRSECLWNARPDVPWIRLEDGSSPIYVSGYGNARIRFSVTENTAIAPRTGTITVGNKTFTVNQGGGICSYTVSPPFVFMTAAAESRTFRINTPEGCTWSAIPNFPWMSVLPGAGTGPGSVTVFVAPNASGAERSGVVTVQGTTFGVVQSADPPPMITSVVNAASLEPVSVSPGQILLIRGERIGPVEWVQGQADLDTFILQTQLEGVRVFFDDVPAPIVWASATQIRTVAPYRLVGKTSVVVRVEYLGRLSDPVTLPVAPVAPGIFTLNETGRGPALARTEDYQFSDPNNPILLGSEMILYVTGEGVNEPSVADGRIIGDQLTRPVLAVRVFLGETQLETTYVGSTPGQVAGMLQINAKVPFDAPVGNSVPLTVYIGVTPAQTGVTVSVRARN
jgi:uncharacterized protein (TIGR03437 family)